MRQAKRGQITKRLGLPTARKLTKDIIKEKIRILEEGIDGNVYKGELHEYAVYYRNWYRFRLKQEPRRAVQTRTPRKAAAKA